MSSPKFTSGHWAWDGEALIACKNGSFCDVAYANESGNSIECGEYDKALIAAAPELYEALEKFIQACHEAESVTTALFSALTHAEAVLKKARGEE